MSDQFPVTNKTVVMTAPAILYTNPIKRGVFAAIADHLQDISGRFAATAMRGLDGDETAARRAPRRDS